MSIISDSTQDQALALPHFNLERPIFHLAFSTPTDGNHCADINEMVGKRAFN
jgi:hypothetical protein